MVVGSCVSSPACFCQECQDSGKHLCRCSTRHPVLLAHHNRLQPDPQRAAARATTDTAAEALAKIRRGLGRWGGLQAAGLCDDDNDDGGHDHYTIVAIKISIMIMMV